MPAAHPQPVALITGAARGIGLATVRRFLAEGCRVALLDGQVLAVDGGFDATGIGLPSLRSARGTG